MFGVYKINGAKSETGTKFFLFLGQSDALFFKKIPQYFFLLQLIMQCLYVYKIIAAMYTLIPYLGLGSKGSNVACLMFSYSSFTHKHTVTQRK